MAQKFYYKTDVPCDGVEIIIDQGFDQEVSTLPGGGTAIAPPYVIGANNIEVFAEVGVGSPLTWTLLTEDDYSEDTTTTIIVGGVVTGDVKVVRKPGRLVEGDHYTRINSQIIEFTNDPSSYNITKVYTTNPAKSKLNPAKIIDTEAGVVITDVPVWDPARGHHFHNAIHAIDIQRGDVLNPNVADPAKYNIAINASDMSEQPWNVEKVGIKWFDTSTIGYLPYYDDKVYPDINDRIFYWGELSQWASVDFYEWTESDVPPEEYDAVAEVQEGDITIPETQRVTGRAKATPYKRTRDAFEFTATSDTQGTQVVSLDPNIYGITSDSDLTGLVNNFIQQFTAAGGGSPLTAETFTLSQVYANNQSLLSVTVNGIPAAINTEPSTTTFTLVGVVADDIVVATITSPTYSAKITVDGVEHTVAFYGSVAQNFSQLIARINDDIVGAIITLNGNEILVTSDTTGSTSTIDIDESTIPVEFKLFFNLINYTSIPDATDGIDSKVTSIDHTFSDGDEVILSTNDTLPAPLEAGTYTVALTGSPATFQLEDADGIVKFTDSGTGIHTIADGTWTTMWTKESDIHEVIDVVLNSLELTSGPIAVSNFSIDDEVDVYINEVLQETLTVASLGSPSVVGVMLSSYTLQPQDTIRIIKTAHDIVEADEEFDPDVTDDGTVHVQYKNFYDYTEVVSIGENRIDEVKTYYFWVGDKTVRTIPNSALSLREAAEQLAEIPIPYIIFQNLKIQEVTVDTSTRLPARYNQIVLRGHAGLINADNRYVLRFTRDLTLRDKLENRENEPMLKNVHTEWEIFREKQTYHPLRVLWDNITESMVEYHLADPTTRIPSRERELYDETYRTDTRYGLGEGQIFVDSDIALATVIADLNSSDNDFYPTDIDVFFQQYSFDTNDNIVAAMDRIYNTFSYEHVNRILHSVILDAFAKKAKYPDIFKTSMVSLHGIRILETAGLYDD